MGTLVAGADLTRAYVQADFDEGRAFTVGQVVRTNDGKKYKFVLYNAATAAVAGVAGEVAYYYAPGGVSTGVQTVTSDLSDSAEVGAGVLQAALADGEWGWVQIGGIATLTINLTAGADGDPLTPTGAGDGTLDVTAAATSHVCAVALDASADIILCQFPD